MKLNTTFDLRTQMQKLVIRSFDVNSTGLPHIDPADSNPYAYGEWFALDGDGLVDRAGPNTPAFVSIFQTFSPDMQLSKKVPLILGGTYEAKTKIFDPAHLDPGVFLQVGNVTMPDGTTKSGLVIADLTAPGVHYVVGMVLEVTTDYLLFIGHAPKPVSI